jgi:hypothetical protein
VYIDGLFLLIFCLVLALAFGLYAKYLMGGVAPTAGPDTGAAKITGPAAQTPASATKSEETVGKAG